MKVWIETTTDKYRLITAMEDSAPALAQRLGVRLNTIYSAISHARSRGTTSKYDCIEIGDLEEVASNG